MNRGKRKTGISVVGEVCWGTHLCQFYHTREDLTEIMAPYFKAGLEKNEFCMWITSEPLDEEDANKILRKAVPDFGQYLKKGQIEIIPHSEWYARNGTFDLQRVLDAWIDKLNQALSRGYDGIRIVCGTAWLEKNNLRSFIDYEAALNNVIGKYNILAICTYSLDRCGISEIINVAGSHQFTLIRQQGKWAAIRNPWYKRAEEKIGRYTERLSILHEIGHAILTAGSIKKISRVALGHIQKLVPVYRVSLVLFDFDADIATVLACGTKGKTIMGAGVKFPLKDFGISAELLRGETVMVEEIPETPSLPSVIRELKADGVCSYIKVPLFCMDKLIGSLNMGRDIKGAFRFEDISIARETASLLAVAIEQSRSQKELKKSEKKYRDLYDNAPDMYHSIDKDGLITNCNDTWVKMLGYKKEEIIGRPLTDFFTEKSRELFKKNFSGLSREKSQLNLEREFVRKDGTIFPAILNVFIESDERGQLTRTRALARDITELKRAENELKDAYQKLKETQEQLIQAEKMVAMGQLAAGISHELNQPLTGVKGFTQAVLMDLDENSPIRGDLEKILEQANRMDKIIQHIRFFARKSEFEMHELDVNKPLEDCLMLLNEQLRVHNIKVKKSLSKDLPTVHGDSNQLEQVFLNIISNARDAINGFKGTGEGGKIEIYSGLSRDKKKIQITFKDSGCGIPKGNIGNIFNPFFTTKSPNGGMGLGLAIAYRIIENHMGSMRVDSEEGTGTTFKIKLPIA